MEIRIEASAELLKDLHHFFHKNGIEIDEQHRQLPGHHLEAGVIAIIASLTPVAIAVVRSFTSIKIAKLKADTEQEKHRGKIEFEELKFLIREGRDWRQVSIEEAEKASQDKDSETKLNAQI